MRRSRLAAACLLPLALTAACAAPAPTPAPTQPAKPAAAATAVPATAAPSAPTQPAKPAAATAASPAAAATAASPAAAATAASPAAATAASPAAAAKPAAGANPKEVEYVKTPRPFIVATIDALKKNDVAAARKAMRDYDAAWNGVEVYVNVRSRELYNRVEIQDQKKIEEGLEAAQPKLAELVPIAEDMLAGYDAAIKLSEAGPALSPLFDDVTGLRVARAELRKVGPSLKANDVATAKAAFEAFDKRWDDVEDLVKIRSTTSYREIEDAMKKVEAALKADKPNPADAGPLVDALVERYNVGLGLVNAAARAADLTKTSASPDDVKAAVTLGQMEAELRASLPLWEAGKFGPAGEHARRANTELFDAASGPLKARSVDAALKKALDAYTSVADKAGDAAKVRAANKSAVEAVATAQQSLVGQFWTDVKLQTSIDTGLLGALKDELSKAAGQSGDAQALRVQSAWGALQVADSTYRQVEPKLKSSAPDKAEAATKAFGVLKGLLPDPNAAAPTGDASSQAIDVAIKALGS